MNDSGIYAEARAITTQLSKNIPVTEPQLRFISQTLRSEVCPKATSELLNCIQQIGDASNAFLVEPYLYKQKLDLASSAIWTLCWLGQAERHKSFIMEAVDPGFAWDQRRALAAHALAGAGWHLKTHRDRDFAQLILRWSTLEYNSPVYVFPPPGLYPHDMRDIGDSARIAAGYAVGADPYELTESEDLIDASVKRFIAERQDG